MNRRNVVKALGSFIAVSGLRASAQSPVRVTPPPPMNIPPAGGDEAGVVDMGTTFHSYEKRARRSVTTFANRTATSERTADGHVETRTTDLFGNEISRFRVESHPDGRHEFVAVDVAGDVPRRTPVPDMLVPTLGWANVQAHLYDRDASAAGSRQWRGALLRRHGTAPSAGDGDIKQIETEFDSGLRAVTRAGGTTPVDRSTWTTLLYDNGAHVGTLRWSAQYRTLEWRFPTINARGYVNDERMNKVGISWHVLPTMAWANVQAVVSYEKLSQMAAKRTAAAAPLNGLRAAVTRLLDAVIVPLQADTPGCDYLHWLDGSVFRPCCDAHDQCYAASGCSAWSWFFGSWSCQYCNQSVIYCFEVAYFFPYCSPVVLSIYGICVPS